MRLLLALLLLVFAPATAFAHPAVGVVMDSRGIVYYSDLTNVWQIARDGTR